MNPIRKILLSSALLSVAALAYAGPGAGPGRGGPGRVPSAEVLATIPDVTPAQQQELRRIAIEQRDAHEALRIKERSEHERIDERGDERIRKLLGEEGFRKFAEWKQSKGRGPLAGARDGGRRGDGPRGRGPRDDDRGDAKPTPPSAPAAPR